jgi:hypothetical protein
MDERLLWLAADNASPNRGGSQGLLSKPTVWDWPREGPTFQTCCVQQGQPAFSLLITKLAANMVRSSMSVHEPSGYTLLMVRVT